MSHPRRWIAVPITPAGSEKSQLDRNVGETGSGVGVMTGVPGFDGVQALCLELLDHSSGATLLQMRNRDHPAGLVNHFGHGLKGGERLFHEGWATTTQKAIEGVIRVGRASVTNHRACYMGPAERASA